MENQEYTLVPVDAYDGQLCVLRPDGTVMLAMCEQSPYHNATVAALVAELNRVYNREPEV